MEWSQHKSCWKKAWNMVLKECVSFRSQFFLWYVVFQFTFMYTIYFNFHYSHQCRYTHYTLLLCLHMEYEKEENNQVNKKTFNQITQVMQVDRTLTTIPMKNDDPYILDVNASCCIFWDNCMWKSNILYNVLDIVSELKDNMLPISVTIICMLTF